MPNKAAQFDQQSWQRGYADGYTDGLEEAWTIINQAIRYGIVSKRQYDERNGMLKARDLIVNKGKQHHGR